MVLNTIGTVKNKYTASMQKGIFSTTPARQCNHRVKHRIQKVRGPRSRVRMRIYKATLVVIELDVLCMVHTDDGAEAAFGVDRQPSYLA